MPSAGSGPGRRALAAAIALGALVLGADPARGANWGGITPGQTVRRDVEARYGRPSRERVVVEGGRTGSEWTYAGDRAPAGTERIAVGFGLLRGGAFLPDLVRSLTVYPKPRVFRLREITAGWGKPDAIGTDEATGRPVFRFDAEEVLIVLDRSGEWAEIIVFGPGKAPAR